MKSLATRISMVAFLASALSHLVVADEAPFKEESLRFLSGPPQQGNGLFQVFGFGMCIAAAGDAASTEWALRRPPIFERNPLMTNRGVRLSSHVLAPAAMWWSTEKLRKAGHGKSALLLRMGMTAGYGYLTLHNLRMAARH